MKKVKDIGYLHGINLKQSNSTWKRKDTKNNCNEKTRSI